MYKLISCFFCKIQNLLVYSRTEMACWVLRVVQFELYSFFSFWAEFWSSRCCNSSSSNFWL